MEFFDRANNSKFEEEIASWLGKQILSTRYMANRLGNISMMGLIYYFAKVPKDFRYTRYDHTLAVAHLTLQLCQNLSLSKNQIRLALLAALTHDMGHGPLSHSSESYLRWNAGTFKSHQTGNHPKKIQSMLQECMETLPQDLMAEFPSIGSLADAVYWITQGKPLKDQKLSDPTLVESIFPLFNSPLSPDVIDGENRALLSLSHRPTLELSACDPEALISAVSVYKELWVVDRHGKSLFEKFSKLQGRLNNWVIHNNMVETGEAMLARAIELAYRDRKSRIRYTNLTDNEVIEKFSENSKSARLWDNLVNVELFIPLSAKDPDLFDSVCKKFPLVEKTLEDFKMTKVGLESWLAKHLKVDADFVISQVSRRLDWNPDYLQFEPQKKIGPDMVLTWKVGWEDSYGMPDDTNRRIEIYIPRS